MRGDDGGKLNVGGRVGVESINNQQRPYNSKKSSLRSSQETTAMGSSSSLFNKKSGNSKNKRSGGDKEDPSGGRKDDDDNNATRRRISAPSSGRRRQGVDPQDDNGDDDAFPDEYDDPVTLVERWNAQNNKKNDGGDFDGSGTSGKSHKSNTKKGDRSSLTALTFPAHESAVTEDGEDYRQQGQADGDDRDNTGSTSSSNEDKTKGRHTRQGRQSQLATQPALDLTKQSKHHQRRKPRKPTTRNHSGDPVSLASSIGNNGLKQIMQKPKLRSSASFTGFKNASILSMSDHRRDSSPTAASGRHGGIGGGGGRDGRDSGGGGMVSGDGADDVGPSGQKKDSDDDDYDNNPQHKTRWKQWKRFSLWCGSVVNSEAAQSIIVVLIVINALMMGIGTFDFVDSNPRVNNFFDTVDMIFLIIFTIELAMQMCYHGYYLFADSWLCFDFIIVIMSWSLESFQIVRAFRVFRAFRLITRVAILRNLVLAIFEVAPSMAAIIALLVLILYIYAVMCTVLFYEAQPEFFGRLDTTLFTLFSMMTLEWADVVRDLLGEYPYAWAIFSTFVIMTSFILYSLMIAVVCDAVKVTEHGDEDEEVERLADETKRRITGLNHRIHDLNAQQETILHAVSIALMTHHHQRPPQGSGGVNSTSRNDYDAGNNSNNNNGTSAASTTLASANNKNGAKSRSNSPGKNNGRSRGHSPLDNGTLSVLKDEHQKRQRRNNDDNNINLTSSTHHSTLFSEGAVRGRLSASNEQASSQPELKLSGGNVGRRSTAVSTGKSHSSSADLDLELHENMGGGREEEPPARWRQEDSDDDNRRKSNMTLATAAKRSSGR